MRGELNNVAVSWPWGDMQESLLDEDDLLNESDGLGGEDESAPPSSAGGGGEAADERAKRASKAASWWHALVFSCSCALVVSYSHVLMDACSRDIQPSRHLVVMLRRSRSDVNIDGFWLSSDCRSFGRLLYYAPAIGLSHSLSCVVILCFSYSGTSYPRTLVFTISCSHAFHAPLL